MKKLYIILFSIFSLFSGQIFAAHLVGGELSYECVGPDQYLLTLKVYRDCNSAGAPFDAAAPITIWDPAGAIDQNFSINFPGAGSDTLELVNLNPCLIDTPDVCVELAIYESLVILPQSEVGDYIIAYQRCCRNNTISNILDPGGTGSTYWVTIPSDTTVQCNSSPTFDNFPPIVICADQPIIFDHSATDLDGDSLVYSMCDPFAGGDQYNPAPNPTSPPPFPNITWLAPYGTANQVGGFPQLGVDSVTGELVGYPDTPGQFVVGVCVEEFRDGISLGTIIRDFQFNVTVCGIDEIAEAEAQIDSVIVLEPEGCAPFEVSFFNIAAPTADSFWDFGDGMSTDDDQPTYTFNTPGTYIVTLTAEDSSTCVIIDSSFIQISVLNCIVCPDSLIVAGPSESCDGDTIALLSSTSPLDSISTTTWTDANGAVIDPLNLVLNNSDCQPVIMTFLASSVCDDDPNVVLTNSIDITVYPSDISPFLTEDATDCSVQLIVDPNCADVIDVTPGVVVQPGDTGSIDFTASYLPSADCAADYEVTLDYDCPNCSIDNVTTIVQACDGANFMVELDITGTDLGTSFTVSTSGGTLGTFDYTDLPVMIGPFVGDEVSTYSITVTDDTDLYCLNTVSFGPVDCLPCSISASELSTYCVGTEYFVDVEVTSTNASDGFTAGVFGSFLYADSPVTIGPFASSEIDVNSITFVDNIEADCSSTIDVGPLGCYVCDIDNVSVDAECTSESSYDVYLSFTGSNVYTISDGVNNITGASAGSNIFIGSYPSNSTVQITITDDLAANCVYTSDPISADCDCDSEPGTIMVNSMNVCPGDLSITDADDFLLEPGQSVYYLYHNQPIVDESNLPDLVSEVYTTGSFLSNDGSAIPCGSTVYVTAIGAYEDLNMSGFPDYDDYCLTVSNTIPVNFLCPIVITVDEVCDNTIGEFTYTFMVSGGLPSAIAGEEYQISGDYFTGTAGLSGSVVVGPIPDLTSYTITATDANGCSGSITQNVECEKVPIELISFIGSAAEHGNFLSWETASEIENDYFTLYSSRDGINYSEIARIDGAGSTSNIMKYNYLDIDAMSGTTYYRLEQTDFDGTKNEVSIVSVTRSKTLLALEVLQLFPLPATENLSITAFSNSSSTYAITVVDIAGRKVMNQNLDLEEGENTFSISVEKLSTGTYFLEISSEEIAISKRFIVD